MLHGILLKKVLLNLDNSISIHHRNLQILVTKMFILNEVFPLKPLSNYNLKNQQEFSIRPMKTVHYGLNCLAYSGPKLWELLPHPIRISF